MAYVNINVAVSDIAEDLSDSVAFADLLDEIHSRFGDVTGFASDVARYKTKPIEKSSKR